MPSSCSVKYCSSRRGKDNIKLYKFPCESNFFKNSSNLRKKRRELWISAIKRKDNFKEPKRHAEICEKHFINGKPADLFDFLNHDWVPSLYLGHHKYYTSGELNKREGKEINNDDYTQNVCSKYVSPIYCTPNKRKLDKIKDNLSENRKIKPTQTSGIEDSDNNLTHELNDDEITFLESIELILEQSSKEQHIKYNDVTNILSYKCSNIENQRNSFDTHLKPYNIKEKLTKLNKKYLEAYKKCFSEREEHNNIAEIGNKIVEYLDEWHTKKINSSIEISKTGGTSNASEEKVPLENENLKTRCNIEILEDITFITSSKSQKNFDKISNDFYQYVGFDENEEIAGCEKSFSDECKEKSITTLIDENFDDYFEIIEYNDNSYEETDAEEQYLTNTIGTQTEITGEFIDQLINTKKPIKLIKSLNYRCMDIKSFENNDIKTEELTGISKFRTLFTLYTSILHLIPNFTSDTCTPFVFLVSTLMKLKFNLPMHYLAYRLDLKVYQMLKYFQQTLNALNSVVDPMVKLPSLLIRDIIENTPQIFKEVFDDKLIMLVDFIEIIVSKNAIPEVEMYYKFKFLVAYSPDGKVTYISEAIMGMLTESNIISHSGLLEYLKDGDIILSNNGCSILQVIRNTDGLLKIIPKTIDKTKNIVPVLKYIKEVFGNIRKKYEILGNKNLTIGTFDKTKLKLIYYEILKSCCGLYNAESDLKSK